MPLRLLGYVLRHIKRTVRDGESSRPKAEAPTVNVHIDRDRGVVINLQTKLYIHPVVRACRLLKSLYHRLHFDLHV